MADDVDEDDDLLAEISKEQVADAPSASADPQSVIESIFPEDLRTKFEFYSYRGAALMLRESYRTQFDELCAMLREFYLTPDMIRRAGGNESDIPKLVSATLRPLGWFETAIKGHLRVLSTAYVPTGKKSPKFNKRETASWRKFYLDGHKIDYVKDRVAFDMEWNSKDQTFDRDLYAFSAFSQAGVIDVGVLLTRSKQLNSVFRALGQAVGRDGEPETTRKGAPRMVAQKYGASTTWMGKLLFRLNAGRAGSCPVLAVGILPAAVEGFASESGNSVANVE